MVLCKGWCLDLIKQQIHCFIASVCLLLHLIVMFAFIAVYCVIMEVTELSFMCLMIGM